ncbi:MAG TPA: hypothetical protein VGK58_21205 [Lacipirellulaceae bacterium]
MACGIILAGSRAQRPGRGGQFWVFLQYLLGFRRLGYDVLYLDALEPDSYVDEQRLSCPLEESWSVRYFRKVMAEFDLHNSYSLLCDGGTRSIGLSRREVIDRVRRASCLINVMGFLRDEEILAAARRRAFLDIDPGFGQMWRELGLADIFTGHDAYVSVGANVGRPECTVPTCGLRWIATVPPVVLEQWPQCAPRDDGKFTSIITWRGIFGPIEYQGTTYGLRVHEFRKFMELPSRTPQAFELALDIHPDETQDLSLLEQNGWRLVDPSTVAGTPHDYQAYIQSSKAEFGVAKNMYVKTRGGWISDRTVCYLASGKPALVQDTGIRELYPAREGLVMFSNMDEAVEGVERICRDYDAHCRAARRVAEEHFDSDKVLSRLLRELDVA